MIDINGQAIDIIAIILTIIIANVMIDWKLSGAKTLGDYLKYRKLPIAFVIVWISISVVTTIFISTSVLSHAGMLGSSLEGMFSLIGFNVSFTIT